jgi:predicted dehydrogenase
MRILLVGYSEIAQRRILPALAKLGLDGIDVASRTRADAVALPPGITGHVFDDYEAALATSEADVAYISTVNSTHVYWAERALRRGYHVIVDKPACTKLEDARRLVALAQRQGRCVAESTVYGYHPQIQAARQAFLEAHSQPTRLMATFSFPPLPADNFRYREDLGGGALWDLGPYAVTPGRLFFEAEPEEILCRVTARGDEVETSFSVMATYPGGRSMVGHFGFTTGYHNRLEVLGPHVTVAFDRAFTTPDTLANILHINQHNQARTVTIPPADSFACFFRAVLSAIDTGQFERLSLALLSDVTALHQLRRACQCT